ncbi:Uncharacterised protein [Mycobacteroides abscessus subsp. abscessus]|nr:Uncharacterised protein [Mycobacteroides abscessus subsp. abscessus]
MTAVAWDSRVSLAGLRTALPTRSAITNVAAIHSTLDTPRKGTVTTVSA